jgi:hypothetical protein
MKIQIDIKSALCGLIIGVATMFAIGAGTSGNENGRYRGIVSASPIDVDRGLALIVDTQTGKAWGVTARNNWHNDGSFWDAK